MTTARVQSIQQQCYDVTALGDERRPPLMVKVDLHIALFPESDDERTRLVNALHEWMTKGEADFDMVPPPREVDPLVARRDEYLREQVVAGIKIMGVPLTALSREALIGALCLSNGMTKEGAAEAEMRAFQRVAEAHGFAEYVRYQEFGRSP